MFDFSSKKFGFISLGCDKNRVDSEKLLAIIRARGCAVCDSLEQANVVVVNTCAFLNAARREAIDTVLDCAAYKSGNLEKIVVTGCLPQKYIDETFGALTEADVFLGTGDYDKLFEALERSYEEGRVSFVGRGSGGRLIGRTLTTPAHYAYLKIAEGCDNRCTYCLIPKIRGRYVSFPMEELVEEAQSLGDISELIIVAQDITRYGIELYGEKKLVEILQKLTALDNINSVRLLYCYPDLLDDRLIEEIARNEKIVKYLDIPLQHSEDRILKLMNRAGGREYYLDLIARLKSRIEGVAIRSTFIAGFPTETEEECDGLVSFLEEAQLDNCGFFAYSREPDTPAYRLGGQVPYALRRRRVKRLYEAQRRISADRLSGYIGKRLKVLCDGIDYDRGCFVGRAYFQSPEIDGVVYFNCLSGVQGRYYDVLIERADSYDLYGATEDYRNERG